MLSTIYLLCGHMLGTNTVVMMSLLPYSKRIKKLDPLRAKNIFTRKAEYGPYLGFSYKSLISEAIRYGKKKPEENTCTVNWQI